MTTKAAAVDELRAKNVSEETINRLIKPQTYDKAVVYLGVATLILVVGGVTAVLMDKQDVSELWIAVGVSVGALAGIFGQAKTKE